MTLHLSKAQPLRDGDKPTPDLTVVFDQETPPDAHWNHYQREADDLVDAMWETLSGGMIDAVLAQMMHRRASLLCVGFRAPEGEGGARTPRQQLVDLLHDAWGVIANAENYKVELVDGQPKAIGPQEWRDAAERWRDRFHEAVDREPRR